MVMFTFLIFDRNTLLGKIWLEKSKLSITKKVYFLNYFQYAEFSDDIRFFFFRPEINFLGKFRPKSQNCVLGKIKYISVS